MIGTSWPCPTVPKPPIRVKCIQRWSRASCCRSAALVTRRFGASEGLRDRDRQRLGGRCVITAAAGAQAPEDVADHDQHGDHEDRARDHVDLRWHRHARSAPDEERERRRRAGDEVGDDEVVDRESEPEQRSAEDRGSEQRQRDLAERRERAGAKIHRRLFEVTIEVDQSRLHRDDDVADDEHHVGDEDRPEAREDVHVEEERQQRGSEHDLGRRHRQEDQHVGGAAPTELVTDDREREHRAEDRRSDRRDDPDLERGDDRVLDPRDRVPVDPVVEREPFPDVVVAPGRRVEREQDHDRDREHQVAEREERVGREDVATDPAHRQPVSLSVPTTLA